ncbi:MAG: hypothetical protein K8I02_07985 [Candidatus Methylomirabilis sp.]|nr:hypothetical protein [Deltaproteobacteria bacterium]
MERDAYRLALRTIAIALGCAVLLAACGAFAVKSVRGEFGERAIAQRWCDAHGGVTEFRFADGTRADCLTAEYVIEFDWAHKWAEAFGQAAHYQGWTCETPAVGCRRAAAVLILKKPSDVRYAERLRDAARRAGVDLTVWTVEADK